MSMKAVVRVTDRIIGSPSRRLMMIAMADRASPDGTKIYASMLSLAKWSEISLATAKRVVADFLKEGLIEETGRHKFATGQITVEYRIVFEKIDLLPPSAADVDGLARRQSDPGVVVTPGSKTADPGVTVSYKPVPNLDSPSESKSHPGRARPLRDPAELYDELAAGAGAPPPPKPRIRTQLNPALALTEKGRAFARERGFDDREADSLFQRFRDHHLAKGSTMVDWGAAWRTWVNNEVKFNGAGRRETAAASGGARPAGGRLGGRSPVSVLRELTARVREREAELSEHGQT